MTEGRPSKGNLVRILNLILKELKEINSNLKGNSLEKAEDKDRFRNQNINFYK